MGPSEPFSGSVLRVAEWVARRGHDVWVVGEHDPHQTASQGRGHFIPFRAKEQLRRAAREGDTLDPRASLAQGVRELQEIAAKVQPDIVHAHHIEFESLCCARAGLEPLVVSVWGGLNHLIQPELNSELGWAAREVIAQAAALLVDAPALKQACLALPDPPRRVEVIPLGVDSRRFHPDHDTERPSWRRTLNVPKDAYVLLSPRGWGRIYQHTLILEAFALARPRLPQPSFLAFAKLGRQSESGEGPRLFAEMQERAAQLGVSDAVRAFPLLPYTMMPALFAFGDMVINYLTQDAVPSTLLEAAACGKPVVTTMLPAYARTFIEDCFRLVAPNDPIALAEAMVETAHLSHDELTQRLTTARERVVSEYDEVITQERLFRLYDEVIAASSAQAQSCN